MRARESTFFSHRKSTNPGRIAENFGALAVAARLTDADMAAIAAEDKHFRLLTGWIFCRPGQKWQELWDNDKERASYEDE